MDEYQPVRPAEHFTVEQFLDLLGPHDTTKLELIDGRIYCGGEPFYDLVFRYIAALGLNIERTD